MENTRNRRSAPLNSFAQNQSSEHPFDRQDSGKNFMPPPFQLKETSEEEETSQLKSTEDKGEDFAAVPPSEENNTGLPDELKAGIEGLSGISMGDTKVHFNSEKPAEVNAHAFAQGSDIHVAPGQEKHLPHEAWHVVQQKQGRVQPTTNVGGKLVNDDQTLETEADVMGDKAMQMKARPGPLAQVQTSSGKVQQQLRNGGGIHRQFGGMIQRKPVAVDETKAEIGDKFRDDAFGLDLVKLNETGGFLYDERKPLFWSADHYKDTSGKPVNPAELIKSEERILEVAMGELGMVKHKEGGNLNGYTHMRTSNASPCLILTIHSPEKSLMAHIHVGNTQDQIDKLMHSVPDSEAYEVCLITKGKAKDTHEVTTQNERYTKLDSYFKGMGKISYRTTREEENATLDLGSGDVRHHADAEVSLEMGTMTSLRSFDTELEYQGKKGKPEEYPFDVREANVTEMDDSYNFMGAGKKSDESMGGLYMSKQLKAKPAEKGKEVAQLVKVYKGPTRDKADGFDEAAMYSEFSKSADALELEELVGELGFRYAGDTGTESKANTDVATREIRINKGLSAQVAALSLGYELKNAQQKPAFDEIMLLLKSTGKEDLAIEFADRIMKREARSILFRSKMAIAMGNESLVKNPVYNTIAKRDDLDEFEKVAAIFKEMKANGTVHGGAKKAYDHYIEMYWANVPKPTGSGKEQG